MASGPIPTLQEQNGVVSTNYLKHGLYRSSGSSFTNTLYQDGFRRGATEADVLPAFVLLSATTVSRPNWHV